MKANELMVGDYCRVNKDVCIKKDTIVEVRSVDADRTLPSHNLEGATTCRPIGKERFTVDGGVWAEYLSPIPLSPDILRKNGFCLCDVDLYHPAPAYVWCMDGERNDTVIEITFYNPAVRGVKALVRIQADPLCGGGVNKIHNCDIEYVHQLQHALKLCGINKEIVL